MYPSNEKKIKRLDGCIRLTTCRATTLNVHGHFCQLPFLNLMQMTQFVDT